jgi:cbb3-type cytochrome oxidase cytochrome c subunit
MHDKTIAEAVTNGKPTVIVFATPAFCTSQICGPTKDLVDDLYGAYADQANFVHVEPYDVAKARAGEDLVPITLLTQEWGLTSEPWVFVVDSSGMISAKFDGIASYEELEAALTDTLPS